MAAGGGGKYPPTEFSQKYASVLAPKGKLLTPKDVFGEGGPFASGDVEEKTRQAFKITVKKLEKLNTPSVKIKEELKLERIDQIVECFPNSMPKDLPDVLQKIKWSKPAKEVTTWEEWWCIHERIPKSLRKQAKQIHAWWEFTGAPDPGEDGVLAALKRLVSGVLTHPVTIGKLVSDRTKKRKKNVPKSVHLVGTDRPEATMIYAGFFQEILAANPLHPIKLTLVSPDEANRQLSQDCGPDSPMLINPRCKLTAWAGLYHDFWDDYIDTHKVECPDLVVGLHPDLHSDDVFEFWEPTLELLLDKTIVTAFTFHNEEEYRGSLERLEGGLFARCVFKGRNPFASCHVKQTQHNANMVGASNQFLIVFKGRTVDLKTLTLIDDPDAPDQSTSAAAASTGGGADDDKDVDEEFERILRESEKQ